MGVLAPIVALAGGLAVAGVIAGLLWRGGRRLTSIVQLIGIGVVLGAVLTLVARIVPLITGDAVTVQVPLEPFPPHPAPGIHLGPRTAQILSGGADRATLSVSGLSAAARATLAASAALEIAAVVVVAVVIVRLAKLVSDGEPFSLGARAMFVCAAAVGVGGTAGTVLSDVGSWLAARDALAVDSWSSSIRSMTDPTRGGEFGGQAALAQYGWPAPAEFALTFPWWPLGAALVLVLLGSVFRAGARLRRETDGLV